MATRVVVSFDGTIVAEVELTRPVTVIGRHPDCEIVLEHPAVSLRHALLRVVDRTVYLEDLASTNGTLVNGIGASNQVLHHLDLVQVGMHKLHFFDDALLSGGVNDLESTVLNEYEHTMLASGVPVPAVPAAAPARPAATAGGDLSRTMAIPRPEGLAIPSPGPGAVPKAELALRFPGPDGAQEFLRLDRANTLVGVAGGDAALVVKRGTGLFLAPLAGHGRMRLNGEPVGPGTRAIREGDRIEVGGTSYELVEAGALPPGQAQA